jgi:hypothetical protein
VTGPLIYKNVDLNDNWLAGERVATYREDGLSYCGNFQHEFRTDDTNAVLFLPNGTNTLISGTYRIVIDVYSNEDAERDRLYIALYDQSTSNLKNL